MEGLPVAPEKTRSRGSLSTWAELQELGTWKPSRRRTPRHWLGRVLPPSPSVCSHSDTKHEFRECNLLPSRNFHLGLGCKGWSLAGVFFWVYLVIIKKAIQGLEPENCNSTIGKKQQSKTPVSSVRLGSPDPHVPRESYLRDIGSSSHTPHFRCAWNVTLARKTHRC